MYTSEIPSHPKVTFKVRYHVLSLDDEDSNLEAMTNKREKSRQRWEHEICARQQNVTPAEYPEGMHYARVDGLPKIVFQGRFWLGIVLVAIGVSMFRSTITVAAAVVACVGVAAGLLFTITAMRLNNKL